MRRIGQASIVAACLAVGAAALADPAPVFLGVSTVGLEPPPGFRPNGTGFQKGNAVIVANSMTWAGYLRAETDLPNLSAALAGPDATVDEVSVGGKRGYIMRGHKTFGGVKCRAWAVILGTPAQSGLVGAYVPADDADVSDAAIEAALKTIAFRDTPGLEAQIGALRQ